LDLEEQQHVDLEEQLSDKDFELHSDLDEEQEKDIIGLTDVLTEIHKVICKIL